MNTILFFVEQEDWKPGSWVSSLGGIIANNGQYVIETPMSWLTILKDDEIFEDYDEGEEKLVRSFLRKPELYVLEWKGDELLHKFVNDFPTGKIAVIDNDHGLICAISDLKGKSMNSWVRKKKIAI